MAQEYAVQEVRHSVPKCLSCGHIGPWTEEPLLLPHHIIITLVLLLAFGGGLVYLLVIVIIRSGSNARGKICPNCNSRNMFTFLYADQGGAPGRQYSPQPAYAAVPVQAPPISATVMAPAGAVAAAASAPNARVLMNGSLLTSLPLYPGSRFSVGRNPASGVVVSDPMVSGTHATLLVHSNGDLGIVDAGSANGTFVNGRQVSGEYRPIRTGDEVILGSSNCRLGFEFG